MASRRTVVVDLVSGVLAGGHQEELLAAVAGLYEGEDVTVIAPYLEGRAAESSESVGGFITSFKAFRRALKKIGDRETVVVAHSPSATDFAMCWKAAKTIRPKHRAACLMVIRRDPEAIVRHRNKLLGKVFIALIVRMMKTHLIYIAADSPLVRDAWCERAPGTTGSVVGVPPLPAPSGGSEPLNLIDPAGPTVALAGQMRADKGAALYPLIAETALEVFEDGGIVIQTADDTDAARDASELLEQRYSSEPRVQTVGGYIESDQYAQLVAAADILVLPYDPDAYGGGSSGILSDALSTGAVVVMTHLPWARAEYSDDPRIVWIEDPSDGPALAIALAKAGELAAEGPAGGAAGDEDFAESWRAAADAAIADAERRSR